MDEPFGPSGPVNFANYTSCAGGLAVSMSFAQAWAAIAYCMKIIAEEIHRG